MLQAEKIEWLQHNGAKRPSLRWQHMLGRSIPKERCIVAMVGDGINDAPVSSFHTSTPIFVDRGIRHWLPVTLE
jgi:hypothetical protein